MIVDAAFAAGLVTTTAMAQDSAAPADAPEEAAAATYENRIDIIRPDAPELAAHGDLPIGVRTVEVTNADQIDVANTTAGG